jgi:type III pantothenate kinase
VSEKGEYLGGAIAPGIAVAAEGLIAQASRLPRVEIVAPKAIIGKNTVEALQSGLVYGTAAEVDGIVERMQKELGGHATVVVTGGSPRSSRRTPRPWTTTSRGSRSRGSA